MNDNELIKQYEELKIGIDEPFKFHCTMCGKCCLHREDILLNAQDLFQIARKFQVKPQEILDRYCEFYIGHDSRLPVVRVRSLGNVKRCVFLKNRKCSIHDVKPTVCALFPIGRAIKLESNKDISNTTDILETGYIFTNPECGDDTELHTVREWLDIFQIPLEDAFFSDWSKATILLAKYINSIEESASKETMLVIWNVVLIGLYLNYDINEDFHEQFRANITKTLNVIQTIAESGS